MRMTRWMSVMKILPSPTLPAKSFYFRDSHSRDADVRQCGAHVVELERLDDRGDQFHVVNSPSRYLWAMLRRPEHFCSFHAMRNTIGKSGVFRPLRFSRSAARTLQERRGPGHAPTWCAGLHRPVLPT